MSGTDTPGLIAFAAATKDHAARIDAAVTTLVSVCEKDLVALPAAAPALGHVVLRRKHMSRLRGRLAERSSMLTVKPSAAQAVVADEAIRVATGMQNLAVTVSTGESLWSIAERELGDGNRWSEIYESNKDTIADPNVIFNGQQIVVPGTKPHAPATDRTAARRLDDHPEGHQPRWDGLDGSPLLDAPRRAGLGVRPAKRRPIRGRTDGGDPRRRNGGRDPGWRRGPDLL